jgi:hypothetical protein
MIEKDYGEEFIDPAKQFIEKINATVAERMGYRDIDIEESGLQYHTGVKKHGKEYMDKAAQAGREGASQEELGRLKDKLSKAEKNKATKESQDIMRLAGL